MRKVAFKESGTKVLSMTNVFQEYTACAKFLTQSSEASES